jgi:tripartite-type tricarboxylate transporter receptor subunit TctC
MNHSKRILLSGLAAAAALALSTAVQAQPAPFPSRAVKLIVATAPGGSADLTARILAEKLSAAWGQPVVVEQRTGANGMVGAQALAKAAPDGYTAYMSLSSMVQNLLLQPNPGYKLEDVMPVSMVAVLPIVLAANATVPVSSVEDLIKLAREKPGALSYGSYGTGGGGHIIGVGLNRAANTQMIHVPYKGEAASFPDLISGQITAAFGSTGFYTPHVAAGKVRLLAVASPARLKRFPNVPTFAEAGYPGVNLPGWTGVFLPAGTPAAIVNKFSQEIRNALAMPDVQNRLLDFGYEPNGTTPEEFAQYIKAELPRWSAVIKENNIKLE